MKVAQSYKDRVRAAAEKCGLNITQWIISVINKELEKLGL